MNTNWIIYIRPLLIACISVTILGSSKEDQDIKHHSTSVIQACHADHDYHREVLNTYLTDSEFSTDRVNHGTNGITIQQVQVVENSDSACAALNSFFSTSMAKTYEGTSDKFYRFTYYKSGGFLFVSRSIKPSPDPHTYASGISTFSVHDSTGAMIKGYAF